MNDPGMAPPGKHVMSIFVQYAPVQAERRLNRREARSVRRRGGEYGRELRAGVQSKSCTGRSSRRATSRRSRAFRRHIFAGELALHQLVLPASAGGWAKFATPCAATTRPARERTGRRDHGASGRLARCAF